MLTPDEEKFLTHWGENRNKPQTIFRQLRVGLSIGLVMCIGIVINFATGWYSRANMVANSQSTPLVFVFAIIIISLFCSFFYKQFNREQNEQRYQELQIKKKKQIENAGVQQDATKSSH